MSSKLSAKRLSNLVAIYCYVVIDRRVCGSRWSSGGRNDSLFGLRCTSSSSKASSLGSVCFPCWLAKSEARGEDKIFCTGVEGIGSVWRTGVASVITRTRFVGRFHLITKSNRACLNFWVGLIVRFGCVIAELRCWQNKRFMIVSVWSCVRVKSSDDCLLIRL